MPYATLTDEQLMLAFYACDDEALFELQRRYGVRLWGYLTKLGVARQDATDILNGSYGKTGDDGVFVRIQRTKYPEPGKPGSGAKPYRPGPGRTVRAWIFRIARNFGISAMRMRNTSRVEEWPEAMEGTPWDPPSDEPTAADLERADELRSDIHDCIDSLPPRERAVMYLFLALGEQPSLKEIDFVLEQSIPTASRVLNRAFQLMKTCLLSKGIH